MVLMRDSGFISLRMDRSFLEMNKLMDEDIGELCRTPSPSIRHQQIVLNLLYALHITLSDDYILLQKPCDLILNAREVRQPDIMMIKKNRISIIKPHAVIAPPNVVIEVQSPTSESLDRIVKMKNYAEFGIPEYWIVDEMNQSIEVFYLEKTHYILHEKLTTHDKNLSFRNKQMPINTIFNSYD